MDQSDQITVTGIRARGRHGVLDHERSHGAEFVVDLTVELDTGAAAASDDLTDTVDYGQLATDVVRRIEGEPVALIETLAARLADDALAHPRVQAARVTVHKPHAPIPALFDDVAVTVIRQKGAR